MCGNILPCFAPLDDCGSRTHQRHWLELLHTSYISLLNQAGKVRVFYSVNKCFETRGDLHNIHKQILKIDAMFVGILLRDSTREFGVEIESSRHREIF